VKPLVEIVGPGAAGLITGLGFAQKGWRVHVHEQNSALTRGEGIYIWENGLRALDALGVLARVVARTLRTEAPGAAIWSSAPTALIPRSATASGCCGGGAQPISSAIAL
jgi:2-polyprenyl-6-methoxyphenol hydroxylase-like FAD-dependent oxidoreductase